MIGRSDPLEIVWGDYVRLCDNVKEPESRGFIIRMFEGNLNVPVWHRPQQRLFLIARSFVPVVRR